MGDSLSGGDYCPMVELSKVPVNQLLFVLSLCGKCSVEIVW
jgi:hypothetical protein